MGSRVSGMSYGILCVHGTVRWDGTPGLCTTTSGMSMGQLDSQGEVLMGEGLPMGRHSGTPMDILLGLGQLRILYPSWTVVGNTGQPSQCMA